jgi:hypothetical protein
MLRILVTALVLSAFTAVMMGCHASGSIGEGATSMHVAK